MFFLSSSLVVLGVLLSKNAEARIEDGDIIEDLHEAEWLAPAHETYHAVTPPCCQPPGIDDINYVLVSTMNGKLVALDAANQGNILWEIDLETAPLLSGTLSRMPPMESNGRWYHLVPSLDGSLYMYSRDERLLEPIPLNTEILLQSSVRIAQDAIAGGKTVTTTGVDPFTGEIRYHCTAAECKNGFNDDIQSTLVFRRSTNAVRAVNALTGVERWNLSVSEYEATLVKRSHLYPPHRISGLRLLVQPPDGIVTAYDGCGNMVWTKHVGSHIVKSWKIESGDLSEISLFDAYNIHTLAVADEFNTENSREAETLFYLGMSNNDPFIIHSDSIKNELRRMARNALEAGEMLVHQPGNQLVSADKKAYFMQGRTIDDLFRLSLGKSYSAQMAATNRMIMDNSGELTVVNPNREDGNSGSCPNGDGVSLIKEDDMRSATFDEGSTDKGWYVLKPGRSTRKSPFHFKEAAKKCAARLSNHVDSWWSFSIGVVAGLSTGIVTIGTILAYACWRRLHKRRMQLEPIARKIVATRETSSGPSMGGHVESVPSTPSEPTPPSTVTSSKRTISGNGSLSESFSSKFMEDFQPVKLLGHGGFGYVFKARNRLDEAFYAVKRVAVADNEKAIDKVLREVRAMAKLKHKGIIGYYHTWIERPPPGWQEETDRDTLMELKHKRNFGNDEEKKQVEVSIQASSLPPLSIRQMSIDAPPLPEESNDGSWLDPEDPGKESEDSNSSESSSDSGSEQKNKPRKLEGKYNNQLSVEPSDGIIFGTSKSRNSKSSEDLWRLRQVKQMVLATTADEELLPSSSTEHFVYLYIQMQLCQEKTLHSWLKRHKLKEDRPLLLMKTWLAQLCSAVSYIHSHDMIHRDLKPQNIFFVDDDHHHLKVGDLGLIKTPGEYVDEGAKFSSSHTGNVGTRGYMSPEQIANQPYTFKVDVFSLGLVFCELVVPFQTVMERSKTLGSLQQGIVPAILKQHSKEERNTILWMTKMNPNERPTMNDILCSEYMKDVYEDFDAGSRRRFQSGRNGSFDRKTSAYF